MKTKHNTKSPCNVMPGSWEWVIQDILGTEPLDLPETPFHRACQEIPSIVCFVLALVGQAAADAGEASYDGDENDAHFAKLWLRSAECADLCDGIGVGEYLADLLAK